ncbi:WD40-repeat-containing domain protein [Microdochium bolleyi]|uniref:WD40-repeat-containing domain protein n=1 Tax=Microdochium bolleyi TaxID=196109 RepID=A0A136IQ98_9PEZI|nr:WD40-repeat-containing domain protein [Microdochium bolleyi]
MSPTTPDRFVPARTREPLADRYHSTKSPHKLSPSERLVRTEDAGPDVFVNRLVRSTPLTPLTPTRRQAARNTDPDHHQAGTVLSLWSSPASPSERQSGRGSLLSAGTNARLYRSAFAGTRARTEHEQESHEGRLALALKMDRVSRILDFDGRLTFPRCRSKTTSRPRIDQKTAWTGSEWLPGRQQTEALPHKTCLLPSAPFKVLDAPGLRDDFYCSIMAYDSNCNTLAVGLGGLLYGWDEEAGVKLLNAGSRDSSWLTAMAFSSEAGEKSLLAFGRSNGHLMILSMYDSLLPRLEIQLPSPIACISWRPIPTPRKSLNPSGSGANVLGEDLVVGDESGDIYYYSVCGLSWSTFGDQFATGGNDNLCCLFDAAAVLDKAGDGLTIRSLPRGSEKHQWKHGAAVKAIAFCPWRKGLLATGGGSNDKCIHFYHTASGATLATIAVSSQVTSLVWSTTRREIAATFGYAQPEHPYRIAEGEHRALYAISYPGSPRETRYRRPRKQQSRTAVEGCIVVASSDESIKFHEVWMAERKATTGLGCGVLGGSDILEMTEGIDKEGDLIR